MEEMAWCGDLPDCVYSRQPIVVAPRSPTPKHLLYLSDLDDQNFLRFIMKYVFVFKIAVGSEWLKESLSRVLVDYYPLAGRLRPCHENDQKLEIDCNGEGAIFAEASMDISCHQFLQVSSTPNMSWKKLLPKIAAHRFIDVPPLVVQVTNLRCGGMILCTAISHCLCDGVGTSQFLHAWAHYMEEPDHVLPVDPAHNRTALRSSGLHHPLQFVFPQYQNITSDDQSVDVRCYLQSQQLVPSSITFTASDLLNLKRRCSPRLNCTSFEALAAHTWVSWAKSLNLPPLLRIKLLFSMNIRNRMKPELPPGYYGNGFVMACVETTVKNLIDDNNLYQGIKLIQQAKSDMSDSYIRSMLCFLEDKTVKADLSTSLVISQWANLGLEEFKIGGLRPLHIGPLASDIYCLFLPVSDDSDDLRVLLSVPESTKDNYEGCMRKISF